MGEPLVREVEVVEERRLAARVVRRLELRQRQLVAATVEMRTARFEVDARRLVGRLGRRLGRLRLGRRYVLRERGDRRQRQSQTSQRELPPHDDQDTFPGMAKKPKFFRTAGELRAWL